MITDDDYDIYIYMEIHYSELIVSIMKNRTMNDGRIINELSCLYGI